MTKRERFTATVEAGLLAAARHAVKEGRADSVSAWVNEALVRQAEHEKKLTAMREFLGEYKADFGEFTAAEKREIRERLRRRTVRVRAKRRGKSGRPTRSVA